MSELVGTLEELEALPVGSVVLDLGPDRSEADAPVVACKALAGDWVVMGEGDEDGRRWWSAEVMSAAQASVLMCVHRPDRLI